MEADLKQALERLTRDVERLESSASYCAHFGTPRFKDQTRWNDQFAADLRLLLSALNRRPQTVAERFYSQAEVDAILKSAYPLSTKDERIALSASRDSVGPAADALDPVAGEQLLTAAQALGAMPGGYCFCSANRIGDDSKIHEPECADLRAAIATAEVK